MFLHANQRCRDQMRDFYVISQLASVSVLLDKILCHWSLLHKVSFPHILDRKLVGKTAGPHSAACSQLGRKVNAPYLNRFQDQKSQKFFLPLRPSGRSGDHGERKTATLIALIGDILKQILTWAQHYTSLYRTEGALNMIKTTFILLHCTSP